MIFGNFRLWIKPGSIFNLFIVRDVNINVNVNVEDQRNSSKEDILQNKQLYLKGLANIKRKNYILSVNLIFQPNSKQNRHKMSGYISAAVESQQFAFATRHKVCKLRWLSGIYWQPVRHLCWVLYYTRNIFVKFFIQGDFLKDLYSFPVSGCRMGQTVRIVGEIW